MSDFLDDIGVDDLPLNDPDIKSARTADQIIQTADNLSITAQGIEERTKYLSALVKQIAALEDVFIRVQVIKKVAKSFNTPPTLISAEVTKQVNIRENRENSRIILNEEGAEAPLPEWMTAAEKDKLYAEGYVMVFKEHTGYPIGIYFKINTEKRLKRVTNYCITPIAHIVGMDSRRLVEITHVYKKAVVELSDNAMVTESAFSKEIISKGPFRKEPGFTQMHYMSLIGSVIDNAKEVQELNTLGWNPNGFFTYSNKIGLPVKDQPGGEVAAHNLVEYDHYGLAKVKDRIYYSPAVSSANVVEIGDENIYENDLYLKYVEAPITFSEWTALFCRVYGERGRFGIAFLFITLFKDIVTTVTKCPHLYCYGPKDSGKSAMCESILRFVFSGKDSSGQPIQGYNVSRGMGTPFSFHNGNERFRNAPRILNEFDLNNVEDYVRGAIKAAYDGEARQVGDGNSFKKKKTRSQKVLCTLMVIGQYLDTSDDGSIPSRSIIPTAFSLQENINRTKEAEKLFFRLRDVEQQGLSSLVLDILAHRDHISRNLKSTFARVKDELASSVMERNGGKPVEQRISNNYSLCLAMVQLMSERVSIPFSYDEFYLQVQETIIRQNSLIKDSSILTIFWKICEILFAEKEIKDRQEFKILYTDAVKIQKEGGIVEEKFDRITAVLYVRFDYLHVKFSKMYYDKYKKTPPNETTMINYIKDQPYFIGLCKGTHFTGTKTSAYMLNYEKIGVNLEHEFDHEDVELKSQKKADDLRTPLSPAEQQKIDDEFEEFNKNIS